MSELERLYFGIFFFFDNLIIVGSKYSASQIFRAVIKNHQISKVSFFSILFQYDSFDLSFWMD